MAEAKSCILIVDDDADDLASVERVLRSMGSELVCIKDPLDVLPSVHRHRPDVVILDALLPGLSGFDLCKQIKTDPQLKGTQVLIVTAVYLRQQYRHEALQQFKADGFLTKPFRPPELQRLVAQLLARRTRTPPSGFLKRMGLPAVSTKKRRLLDRFFRRGEDGSEDTRIAPGLADREESEVSKAPQSNAERVSPPSEPPVEPPAGGDEELASKAESEERPAEMEKTPVPRPENPESPESGESAESAEREGENVGVAAPNAVAESPPALEAPPEPGPETAPAEEPSLDRRLPRSFAVDETSAAEELDARPGVDSGSVTWSLADSRTQELTLAEAAARADAELPREAEEEKKEPAAPPTAEMTETATSPPEKEEATAERREEETVDEPKPQAPAPGEPSHPTPLRHPRLRIGDVPIYDEADFTTELKRELSKCKRVDRPLTLILIRVGDLPQIVELFGKEYREPVLWHVAEQAMSSLREVDLVGMMTSKALVAMTAFAADRYGGGRIVARMRRSLGKRPFRVGEELPPIVPALEFGMAAFPEDGSDAAGLVAKAEEELSAAVKISPETKASSGEAG